jgi:hypothetical protein
MGAELRVRKKPGDFLISKIRPVIWKITDPYCLKVAFGGKSLMKNVEVCVHYVI